MWSTSPACTELETLVLDWLIEACGLPDRFHSSGPGGGVIQDSASSASLCAVLAARDRLGGAAELPRMRIYTSVRPTRPSRKTSWGPGSLASNCEPCPPMSTSPWTPMFWPTWWPRRG
ncbi:MAG: hypothetical protein Ct9H300mP12_16940 [Acidimicrobiales bacterium]|nr:MAG: hypothetical protein Ct9H300mP12_16940 [Acidimicrobiales bacterium]